MMKLEKVLVAGMVGLLALLQVQAAEWAIEDGVAVSPDGKWKLDVEWRPDGIRNLYWGDSSSGTGKLEFPSSVVDWGGSVYGVFAGHSDWPYGGGAGCPATEIVIPNGVRGVAENFFEGMPNLKKVALHLEEVPPYIFDGCGNLEEIEYGEGVKTIDMSDPGFYDESVTIDLVKISRTVETIIDGPIGVGQLKRIEVDPENPRFKVIDGALYGVNSLGKPETLLRVPTTYSKNEFVVPDTVKTLSCAAFACCSAIRKVSIPASVTEIESAAFGASSVSEIQVAAGNARYKTVGGALYTADGKELVAYPPERAAAEFTAAEGVERIVEEAFVRTRRLQKVVLPASVREIGTGAFEDTSAITEIIVLGSGGLWIGDCAFQYCGIRELDLRDRDVTVDGWAFEDAESLKTLHVGSLTLSKNEYGEQASEIFDCCNSLKDVYCHGDFGYDANAEQEDGCAAFACSFRLHVPEWSTLETFVDSNSDGSKTWTVTVVKGLDPLPPEDDGPEDQTVWTIESYGNLHETEWEWVGGVVASPDGKWRMRGCHPCPEGEDEWHLVWESGSKGSAERLEFPAEVEWTDDDPDSETYGRKFVWDVCIGYHDWWGGFSEENGFAAKEVAIPREVKRVAGGAFDGSTTITKFSIAARVVPESVIGEENLGLKEITLGEGAEVVESDAFFLWPVGAGVVDTVRISGTVREIRDSAFSIPVRRFEVDKSNARFGVGDDGALYGLDGNGAKIRLIKVPADYARKEFAVPGTVREVDGAAFLGCADITAVRIGAGVDTIGAGAFVASGVVDIRIDSANRNYKVADGVLFTADGSALVAYPGKRAGTTYAVPEGTTEIGPIAFYLAENLETLTLPASMRRIWNDAFGEACKLSEVKVLGEGGLRVGDYSFGGMPKLKALDLRRRNVTAESCAFEDSDNLKMLHVGSMALNRNENGEYAREIFDGCIALTDVYCYGDFAYGANAAHEAGDAAFAHSFTLHVLKGSKLPARITDTSSDGSKTWIVTVLKDLDPLPPPEDDDKPIVDDDKPNTDDDEPVVVEGVTLKVVGEGTVSGGGKLAKGKKTTLTAKPGSGWVFAGWYDADGEPLEGSVDWRTLKFPYVVEEENVLIEARFATAAEDGDLRIEMDGESVTGEDGSWEDGFRVESLSLPKITVKGLPKGLKWDAKLNKVTGRASVPGEYKVTVSASNATVKKAVSKTTTLTVPNLCSGLYAGLDTETTYEFGVGVGTGEAFPALEVPAGGKVSMKGLPSGMKWDARTGTIAGAPTKSGDYTVTITTKVGKETYVDTVSMTVAPMAKDVAGTYNGFVRDGMSYRGTFTMKVTANGKVAVKMTTAKGTYSFSAKNWDWFEEGIYGATMRSAKGDVLDIAVEAGMASLGDGEHGVWGWFVPAGGEELEAIGDPDMLAKEGGQWKYPDAGALVERFGGKTIGYRMTDCVDGECEWEAVENPKGADLTVKIDAKGKTSVSGKVNGIKVSAKGDVTRDISVVVKDGREKKTLNLYFGYAEGEDRLSTELAGE